MVASLVKMAAEAPAALMATVVAGDEMTDSSGGGCGSMAAWADSMRKSLGRQRMELRWLLWWLEIFLLADH